MHLQRAELRLACGPDEVSCPPMVLGQTNSIDVARELYSRCMSKCVALQRVFQLVNASCTICLPVLMPIDRYAVLPKKSPAAPQQQWYQKFPFYRMEMKRHSITSLRLHQVSLEKGSSLTWSKTVYSRGYSAFRTYGRCLSKSWKYVLV